MSISIVCLKKSQISTVRLWLSSGLDGGGGRGRKKRETISCQYVTNCNLDIFLAKLECYVYGTKKKGENLRRNPFSPERLQKQHHSWHGAAMSSNEKDESSNRCFKRMSERWNASRNRIHTKPGEATARKKRGKIDRIRWEEEERTMSGVGRKRKRGWENLTAEEYCEFASGEVAFYHMKMQKFRMKLMECVTTPREEFHRDGGGSNCMIF